MKLTKKFIDKYLNDFHYELTREQLEQDWQLDKKPYYEAKDCFNFHAADGCWLEVSRRDIADAFVDTPNVKELFDAIQSCGGDCDFKSTFDDHKTLEEIGREDFKESGFCAGVEHEKKIAIVACQKVIDAFYESKFDPSIDYMKIFKENL